MTARSVHLPRQGGTGHLPHAKLPTFWLGGAQILGLAP